jgi:hypothetical protein
MPAYQILGEPMWLSQSFKQFLRDGVMGLLAAAILCGVTFAQSFSFAPINDPAGFNTEARGINASGEIAGFYQTDTSCTETVLDIRYIPNCKKHGFTYVNGTYRTVDVPGATSTVVYGLNDYGDLVGIYTNSDNSIHGFLWLHNGTIRSIDAPSGYVALPTGVNKWLTVVGAWGGGSFRWSNGKFTAVYVNSGPGCGNCNGFTGIANNGLIVGYTFLHDFWDGFLRRGSDFDIFPRINGTDTFTTSVNDKSDIVGYGGGGTIGYFAANVEQNEGSSDIEKTPKYIYLNYQSSNMVPFGINDNRSIVGAYQDSQGIHGLLAVYQ